MTKEQFLALEKLIQAMIKLERAADRDYHPRGLAKLRQKHEDARLNAYLALVGGPDGKA